MRVPGGLHGLHYGISWIDVFWTARRFGVNGGQAGQPAFQRCKETAAVSLKLQILRSCRVEQGSTPAPRRVPRNPEEPRPKWTSHRRQKPQPAVLEADL